MKDATPEELIGHAHLQLEAARFLLSNYNGAAANRAYYAVLYVGQALLKSRGIKAKGHKGVHDRLYRKIARSRSGLLSTDQMKVYSALRHLRRECDYELVIPSNELIEE